MLKDNKLDSFKNINNLSSKTKLIVFQSLQKYLELLKENAIDLKKSIYDYNSNPKSKTNKIYDINSLEEYNYPEEDLKKEQSNNSEITSLSSSSIIDTHFIKSNSVVNSNTFFKATKTIKAIYYLQSQTKCLFSFLHSNSLAYIQSKVLYTVEPKSDLLPLNTFSIGEYNINTENLIEYSINNLDYILMIEQSEINLLFINTLKLQRNKIVFLNVGKLETTNIHSFSYQIFILPNYKHNDCVIVLIKNKATEVNYFNLISFEKSEVISSAMFKGGQINLCDLIYDEYKKQIIMAVTFFKAKNRLFVGVLNFTNNPVFADKEFINSIDNLKFATTNDLIISFTRNQEKHNVVNLNIPTLDQVSSIYNSFNQDFIVLKSFKNESLLLIKDDNNMLMIFNTKKLQEIKSFHIGEGVVKKISIKENNSQPNPENEFSILSQDSSELIVISINILIEETLSGKQQHTIKCFDLKYKI